MGASVSYNIELPNEYMVGGMFSNVGFGSKVEGCDVQITSSKSGKNQVHPGGKLGMLENFIVLLEAGKGRAFAQRIPCPNAKPGEVFLEKIPAKLLKLGCSYTVELIMQQKAIFWGSYPALVLATSDVMHVTNIETKMTQMVVSITNFFLFAKKREKYTYALAVQQCSSLHAQLT